MAIENLMNSQKTALLRPRVLQEALLNWLGSFEATAGRFENEPYTDTQAGEHVDERVSAEEVNPAPKQITYPRLRYPENFGHLGLLETSGRD